MRVVTVSAGRVVDADWAQLHRTGIDKRPVPGRVAVRAEGLDGDEQADRKSHGGPEQAVYAYAREDLDWWAAELGRELRDGMFGENLTTLGLDVNGALIGERWRIGSALLEVTAPRVPCATFRGWMGEPGWVKRFTQAERPGAYLRVVQDGELGAGDGIRVEFRPETRVTVAESFRAYHGAREVMRRLLKIPGRSHKWDSAAKRVLGD
ncbi:MOSC domain-containing protein [Rhizohabitans arisaemae]|uniref:MOSC domain-containing protein n=1 Tax=Rhizohabitans arisaemae TaxID=2720610 RepID=UPI0024B0ECC5|nr:MOSC domain-containing protein [Rhizohabitans arisaemae]